MSDIKANNQFQLTLVDFIIKSIPKFIPSDKSIVLTLGEFSRASNRLILLTTSDGIVELILDISAML